MNLKVIKLTPNNTSLKKTINNKNISFLKNSSIKRTTIRDMGATKTTFDRRKTMNKTQKYVMNH